MVLEILLPSKMAKFPFRTMDYNPWLSKNLIDRNRLKKFMHVGIDVICMYIILVGMTSMVLEILLSSKMAKFSFRTIDYSGLDHFYNGFEVSFDLYKSCNDFPMRITKDYAC